VAIGYRNPPQHTRFTKGRSGNPKGRPKGVKNLKTDLMEELEERIPVREGKLVLHMTKQRALIKSLVNKGLKGDVRAADTVMKWRMSDQKDPGADAEELTADEHEVLAVLQQRVFFSRRSHAVDKGDGDDGEKGGAK
jgi:hypothetical protein